MKKIKKVIAGVLGTAILGAGGIVTTVAQACTSTPTPQSNQNIALNAFRALNGTDSMPAENTSELIFYNGLLSAVQILDSAIVSIAIEIINSTVSVIANNEGSEITVTANDIMVTGTTNQGIETTYVNTDQQLTVSGIIFQDRVVNGVGIITGLVQVNNATVVGDTFRNLNTATSEPTDSGQAVFYRALLEEIQRSEPTITGITRITINNAADTVRTTNDNNQIQVVVAMGALTINTSARDFINSSESLIVNTVAVEEAQVQTVGTITGLIEQTDLVIAALGVRMLNGITSTPDTGTSALLFYTRLQSAVTNLEPTAVISRITINNPTDVTSTENGGVITVTVTQNSLSIFTTEGTQSNLFQNTSNDLVFNNVEVTNNIVTTASIPTELTEVTNQNIAQNSFRALDNVSEEPAEGTSERTLYLSLLRAIQVLDGSGVESISISIDEPDINVSATGSGNRIIVTTAEITINSTGGLGRSYSNPNVDLEISNIVYENGVIATADNATGLVDTNQAVARTAFVSLNGVTPSNLPAENTSARTFYDALLVTIQTKDPSGVTGISITLTDPSSDVLVSSDASSVTVLVPNGIEITATGGNGLTYTNTILYIIPILAFSNGIVSIVDTQTNSAVLSPS